jgi:hypothetical protein
MGATSESGADDRYGGANGGWIAGFLVIAAIMVIGAAFWFSHHP